MEGEITGRKTVTGTIRFTGCKLEQMNCRTEGSKNYEEIITQPLEGTLVYLSKTAKTVGIDFKAKTGTAVVHRLRCWGGIGEVTGSIVMPVTPVNVRQTEFKLEATGRDEEYETEKGEKKTAVLESEFFNGSPLFWGFNSYLNVIGQEKIEIKA